jgi:hypothetical protein
MMRKDFAILANHDIAVPETPDTVAATLAEAKTDGDFTLGTAGLDLCNLRSIGVDRCLTNREKRPELSTGAPVPAQSGKPGM